MNSSLFTADRETHVKIVVVALVAAIVVAAVAITGRIPESGSVTAQRGGAGVIVKAGEPARYSIRSEAAIR